MIFTKQSILAAIEKGKLTITPFDESSLKEASYSFTLDTRIRKLKSVPVVDLDKAEFEEGTIGKDGYIMRPGEFVVGYTREKLTLHGRYACILSTRGTIAQKGLAALLTDTFCEPDTDNQIALAMHNVSGLPIKLVPGLRIVKGVFTLVK